MEANDPRITPTTKRIRWNSAYRAFVDEHGEIYETEQQIEARGPCPRLPAFAPLPPLDGYVQIGSATYERIGPGPDFRDVWQEQFRPTRASKRTERLLEAITATAAVLLNEGEGARRVALELLDAAREP